MTQRAGQPGLPLLPSGYRLAAIGMLAVCALVVGILGALYHDGSAPGGLDAAVARHLPGLGGQLGSDLAACAHLGSPLPATVLTVLLAYTCLALRRYRGAIMTALAVPIAAALTEFVLKPLVHRTLTGYLSMPSGHSTAAFAIVACAVVLLVNPPGRIAPAALRVVLAVFAVAAGCGVALGLVIGHVHYFTDTISGAAVGTGITLSIALVLDIISRRRTPDPVAAAARAEHTPVA